MLESASALKLHTSPSQMKMVKFTKSQMKTFDLFLVLVVCAAASLDTSRGYFTWQETYPQEIAEVQCENGTTTRFCSVLGEWEKPNISDCYVSAEALFKYIDKVGWCMHCYYSDLAVSSSWHGCIQHGFSENNLRELLFATRLLVREKERPKIKYARTTLKTFLEFADQVEGNSVTVDSEVSSQQQAR